MSIIETPNLLHCTHCFQSMLLFPSTSKEDKDNFRKKHALCLPRFLPDPYRGKDWELRGAHPKEHLL